MGAVQDENRVKYQVKVQEVRPPRSRMNMIPGQYHHLGGTAQEAAAPDTWALSKALFPQANFVRGWGQRYVHTAIHRIHGAHAMAGRTCSVDGSLEDQRFVL